MIYITKNLRSTEAHRWRRGTCCDCGVTRDAVGLPRGCPGAPVVEQPMDKDGRPLLSPDQAEQQTKPFYRWDYVAVTPAGAGWRPWYKGGLP